jgi:hypothetical protein
MKSIQLFIALLLLGVAGVVGVGNAWADRGYVRFGVVIGPYGGPWYYPPPPYYSYPPYYPVVIENPAPQIYIEQQPASVAAPAAAAQDNYWYYCAAAKGYYPYVKKCPSGWQQVSPQPPGQH